MGKIHMKTEQVRSVARTLDLQADRILRETERLNRSASRLDGAWHGGRSGSFLSSYRGLIRRMERQGMALETLALRVQREVDQWESADRSGFGQAGGWGLGKIGWLLPLIPGIRPVIGIGELLLPRILPFIGNVRDGIHNLYRVGLEQGREWIEKSDQAIDSGLQNLLKEKYPGSSETIRFDIRGEVTIPGIEVGVPGSFQLAQAEGGWITRNPDGSYVLTLRTGGSLGIEEDLYEGKARVQIGQQSYGIGADVDASAALAGYAESSYRFDPGKPGEMTKMYAFVMALGLISAPPGGDALIGPALYTMKDNLVGVKVSTGIEGEAKADAHALIKLAEIKASGDMMETTSLTRTERGWEQSHGVDLGLHGEASVLTNQYGAEISTSLESVRLEDGSEKARVIVTVQGEYGREVTLKAENLAEYVPGEVLKKVNFDLKDGAGYRIEYELDQPAESLKRVLINEQGSLNLDAVRENSHLTVSRVETSQAGVGGEVGVGLASQSVDIGGEVTARRISQQVVYQH